MLCADTGVPFLLDACQSIGQLPLDVHRLHCDFLAATARKFLRGPRGIGLLYVSDRMLAQQRAPLYVDMRGARWTDADDFELVPDAKRFENWECACALVLGLGAAARYALQVGVEPAGAYAAELADHARQRLEGLPGLRVLDRGTRRAAIVTVEIAGYEAPEVVALLRDEAINTSATGRDTAVIDMDEKRARTALRVSPHYYNTRREIDILAAALEALPLRGG